MTPDANDLCVFAVKRGIIEGRIDPHFYLPQFQSIISVIKKNPYVRLGDIAQFSKETTDYSEFEAGTFEYLEISGVSLGIDKYSTTTISVCEAPSRAKMRTKPRDIAVALTRPHRGAITLIKDTGIIASTGFSIIRDVDFRVDKEWLLFVLLSNASLQQLLQRSSGGNYPAIIEEEVKHIYLPLLNSEKQLKMINVIKQSLIKYNKQLDNIDTATSIARKGVFERLGIYLPDYRPSLFSYSRLGQIKTMGLYCNPHSAYLNDVFSKLHNSKYHSGALEDFVDVNPTINRARLNDSSDVSFVPMPSVSEKTNQVRAGMAWDQPGKKALIFLAFFGIAWYEQ